MRVVKGLDSEIDLLLEAPEGVEKKHIRPKRRVATAKHSRVSSAIQLKTDAILTQCYFKDISSAGGASSEAMLSHAQALLYQTKSPLQR